MSEIIIGRPYIVDCEESKTRLVTDLRIDGHIRSIFIETDSKYREYMVTENCDAVLCFMVVYAMRGDSGGWTEYATGERRERKRYDIVCEAPVTEIMLYKMRELAECATAYNKNLFLPKITPKVGITNSLPNKGAVLTAISLGVDSFYAIKKFLNPPYPSLKLTHVMHNDLHEYVFFRRALTLYHGKKTEEAAELAKQAKAVARDRVVKIANQLGLECCLFDVHLLEPLDMRHRYFYTFINSGYIAHSFSKLFSTVIVPSGYDLSAFSARNIFSNENNEKQDILNLYALSTAFSAGGGGINFIPDSQQADRLDKTKAIADDPIVQENLTVCWGPKEGGQACNKCPKCRRTIIMLDYLGVLEKYANVFDIEYYVKNFAEYKEYLLQGNDMKTMLFSEKRYLDMLCTVIAKRQN